MTDINTQLLFDSDGDNSAQACRTSGGYIDYIHVVNPNGVDAYLQLFNVAAAGVTVGSTTPNQSYLIPANGAFDVAFAAHPMHFATAVTYACTTTATGSGDPSTGLTVNIVHH